MSDQPKAKWTPGLRFFRVRQDHGDPRRGNIHFEFERLDADGNRTIGHAFQAHPQFSALLEASPGLVEALQALITLYQETIWSDDSEIPPKEVTQAQAALRKAGAL